MDETTQTDGAAERIRVAVVDDHEMFRAGVNATCAAGAAGAACAVRTRDARGADAACTRRTLAAWKHSAEARYGKTLRKTLRKNGKRER